jgi:MoaA/NifB/PqqE/SkfB family radical SAM enzyme
MKNQTIQYLSGFNALFTRLHFRVSLLKYLLNKKRYSLFVINHHGKGLFATIRMMRKLRIRKIVKHGRSRYFSLTVPHWPSKAFDVMVENGGLNITAAGTRFKRQIDNAIIGITPKCLYKCTHCYDFYNIGDDEKIPAVKFIQIVRMLQEYGVNIITLSGGEPMLRYNEVLDILRAGNTSFSDFHMHTSGYGVTVEKARKLRSAGLQAAGIGLDDIYASRNDAFRGYKGAYKQAIKAIKCFQDEGVFTYVNTCPSRELVRSGDIYKFMELMKDLKIGLIRWIEPKPCGLYLNTAEENFLADEDKVLLEQIYRQYNTLRDLKSYPGIIYDAVNEAPEHLGCMMAGLSHFYINTNGEVQPCEFLPVTFGNIMTESFDTILERMQEAVPSPFHTICPAEQLHPIFRQRFNNGFSIPVPYKEIKRELNALDTT